MNKLTSFLLLALFSSSIVSNNMQNCWEGDENPEPTISTDSKN